MFADIENKEIDIEDDGQPDKGQEKVESLPKRSKIQNFIKQLLAQSVKPNDQNEAVVEMPDFWSQYTPPTDSPLIDTPQSDASTTDQREFEPESETEPPPSIDSLIRQLLERFGSKDFQSELDLLAEKLTGSKMLPIPLILKRLSNLVNDEIAEGHPRLQLAIHNILHPEKAFPLPDSKDIYNNIYDSNYTYTRRPQQKHFSKRVLGSWTHFNNNITDPRTLTHRKILARTRAMEDRLACFALAADFAKPENADHREVEVCTRAYQTHGVRYVLTVYLENENQLNGLDDDVDIWRTLWVPYSSNPAMYHYIRVGWNLCLVSEVGLRFDDASQAPWDESENGIPHIIEYLREKKVHFKVWPVFDYQKDMPEAKITITDIIESLDTVDATDWISLFTVSFGEAAKIADTISKQQVPLDQIQNTYYANLDVIELPPVGGPVDKLLTPVNISVYKKILPWIIAFIMVGSIAATSYCNAKKIKHEHILKIFNRWGLGSMDDMAVSPRKRIIVMNHPASKFESHLGFGPARLLRLIQRVAHQKNSHNIKLHESDALIGDLLKTEKARLALFGEKHAMFGVEAFVVHFTHNWKTNMGIAEIVDLVMHQNAEFGYIRLPIDKYPVKKLWKELKKSNNHSGVYLVIQVHFSKPILSSYQSHIDNLANNNLSDDETKTTLNTNPTFDLQNPPTDSNSIQHENTALMEESGYISKFTYKNIQVIIPYNQTFSNRNAAKQIHNSLLFEGLKYAIPLIQPPSIEKFFSRSSLGRLIPHHYIPKIELFDKFTERKIQELDNSHYNIRDLYGFSIQSNVYRVVITFYRPVFSTPTSV